MWLIRLRKRRRGILKTPQMHSLYNSPAPLRLESLGSTSAAFSISIWYRDQRLYLRLLRHHRRMSGSAMSSPTKHAFYSNSRMQPCMDNGGWLHGCATTGVGFETALRKIDDVLGGM
ncbi:unnamed protein product [Strongylus vulgaris]|uniref:Uncharacterized protein n=1 Tax=Strongylus vulgaris TaxID=40348 RepID=A0A3P7L514_STRVU|nr:unnamed protein product [Strongylus vulgaris]